MSVWILEMGEVLIIKVQLLLTMPTLYTNYQEDKNLILKSQKCDLISHKFLFVLVDNIWSPKVHIKVVTPPSYS